MKSASKIVKYSVYTKKILLACTEKRVGIELLFELRGKCPQLIGILYACKGSTINEKCKYLIINNDFETKGTLGHFRTLRTRAQFGRGYLSTLKMTGLIAGLFAPSEIVLQKYKITVFMP